MRLKQLNLTISNEITQSTRSRAKPRHSGPRPGGGARERQTCPRASEPTPRHTGPRPGGDGLPGHPNKLTIIPPRPPPPTPRSQVGRASSEGGGGGPGGGHTHTRWRRRRWDGGREPRRADGIAGEGGAVVMAAPPFTQSPVAREIGSGHSGMLPTLCFLAGGCTAVPCRCCSSCGGVECMCAWLLIKKSATCKQNSPSL